MQELKYNTNINCSGCIKTITPILDNLPNINWDVDTTSKDKILTVKGDFIDNNQIIETVKNAGFEISPRKKKLFGLF